MERTKPKQAGWRSFRLDFEAQKRKSFDEEYRHTPETVERASMGDGCYLTRCNFDKLDQN